MQYVCFFVVILIYDTISKKTFLVYKVFFSPILLKCITFGFEKIWEGATFRDTISEFSSLFRDKAKENWFSFLCKSA